MTAWRRKMASGAMPEIISSRTYAEVSAALFFKFQVRTALLFGAISLAAVMIDFCSDAECLTITRKWLDFHS